MTTPKVTGKGQGPFSFELACTTARVPVALAPKDAAFTLKADGKRTISVPSSATCKVQETNLADGVNVKYEDTSGRAHDGKVKVAGSASVVVTNAFPPAVSRRNEAGLLHNQMTARHLSVQQTCPSTVWLQSGHAPCP